MSYLKYCTICSGHARRASIRKPFSFAVSSLLMRKIVFPFVSFNAIIGVDMIAELDQTCSNSDQNHLV